MQDPPLRVSCDDESVCNLCNLPVLLLALSGERACLTHHCTDSQISNASCSVLPSSGSHCLNGFCADDTTSPRLLNRMKRVDVVPWSIAPTYRPAILLSGNTGARGERRTTNSSQIKIPYNYQKCILYSTECYCTVPGTAYCTVPVVYVQYIQYRIIYTVVLLCI